MVPGTVSREEAARTARSMLSTGAARAQGSAASNPAQRQPVQVGIAGGCGAAGGVSKQSSSGAAAHGDASRELAEAIHSFAAVLQTQRASTLEDVFNCGAGAAASEEEYHMLIGSETSSGLIGGTHFKMGDAVAVQRLRRMQKQRHDIAVTSHEAFARRELAALPGKAWSWDRHAHGTVLPHAPGCKTLRRFIAAAAGASTSCMECWSQQQRTVERTT